MGRSRTRFSDSWCEEFSVPRKINNERRLVELRKEQEADGNDLGIFFFDSEDTAAPLEVHVVESFCQSTSFQDVKNGKGLAGSRRAAWLDDRNSPDLEGSGETREYENPLTATGLLRALEPQRFNHEKLHDAARRLIYISDLNPDYIHALAATASELDAHALRSAIYRHLVFRPSIAVKIPSAGFLTFQMELHLPFFILRKSPPPDITNCAVKMKPDRGWTDLSFLDLDIPDSNVQPPEGNEVWSLQEAQISCVVTGTDDWRWTAYGFVDAEVDGLLTDAGEEEMGFDQIAGGRIEAKYPIWRPRDYLIRVFELRINEITREYENLLCRLNLAFDRYMKVHPSTLSPRPDTSRNQTAEMKLAFDWALQMMRLLQKLRNVLLPTVEAWSSFNSEDGGVDYLFDDLEDATKKTIQANAARHRSIRNIKKMFSELGEYLSNITALNEKCSDYKRTLELSLTLGQKEAADKNEFISVFTVIFLYPVALAAGIFSMQQAAVPFEQSPRSFMITLIIIMVIVSLTQFFGIHALPLLRKQLASVRKRISGWIEQGKQEEGNRIIAETGLGNADEPETSVGQERVPSDVERATFETSTVKATTWMSWLTGTTIS